MMEKLVQLKTLQEQSDTLGIILAEKKIAFEEENAALIKQLDDNREIVAQVKEIIKWEALELYDETGNKKLVGGIGIRVNKKLIYDDEKAILWAKGNMAVCVKEVLDKKVFESFAKDNDLSIVEREEKVLVTFPKIIKLEDEE